MKTTLIINTATTQSVVYAMAPMAECYVIFTFSLVNIFRIRPFKFLYLSTVFACGRFGKVSMKPTMNRIVRRLFLPSMVVATQICTTIRAVLSSSLSNLAFPERREFLLAIKTLKSFYSHTDLYIIRRGNNLQLV